MDGSGLVVGNGYRVWSLSSAQCFAPKAGQSLASVSAIQAVHKDGPHAQTVGPLDSGRTTKVNATGCR
jgi:hypothetical protein